MLTFASQTPAAWQKKWARNLQINKKKLTSKVCDEGFADISDRLAKKMIR
jgi:hypothetical protein